MSRLFGRLALGLFGAFALAGAASAQQTAYVEGDASAYGYEEGYASASRETQSYTEDRYGARRDRSGSGYETGYGYEYGSRDGYERVRHEAGPRPCDWSRPRDPRDADACPPGYGLVTLPGSFFHGSGSVGPEIIYYGGGGGGYGYAYAGAAAGAYAFASASASARVSYGGGRGGHRPRKGGGHCGCR